MSVSAGQIVLFKPSQTLGYADVTSLFAAIVAATNEDSTCNLSIIDNRGNSFGVQNVQEFTEGCDESLGFFKANQ